MPNSYNSLASTAHKKQRVRPQSACLSSAQTRPSSSNRYSFDQIALIVSPWCLWFQKALEYAPQLGFCCFRLRNVSVSDTWSAEKCHRPFQLRLSEEHVWEWASPVAQARWLIVQGAEVWLEEDQVPWSQDGKEAGLHQTLPREAISSRQSNNQDLRQEKARYPRARALQHSEELV